MSTRATTVFVNLLFCQMAGILFAQSLPSLYLGRVLLAVSTFIFLLLILANIFYVRLKIYRYKMLFASTWYLLILLISGWASLLNNSSLQADHFAVSKLDAIAVVLDEAPQLKGKLYSFKARVSYGYKNGNLIKCKGRLIVRLTDKHGKAMDLAHGDALMLPARYTSIDGPQNPAEFDYKNWLAKQNIGHQLFTDQQNAILTGRKQGNPLIAFALDLRQQQVNKLAKLIHDQEAFSVASTLILGYRADLSKETLGAYADTGTIHALSVSGMHVGIIYVVLNWLLTFMDRQQSLKLLKILLIIGLIWFYALLTGFSPSVLRSAIMLSCFIVGKSWNRRTNSYNILAFSAFILLVCEPFLLFDVGFQLSYLSVLGLIYLQPPLYNLLYFKPAWADKLWQFLALSMAAQLATFPLSVYYFHQFPVYFLLSNLFILLPVTLMMYLGLGMLIFGFNFLAPLLERIIILTNDGLKWIAELPYSTIAGIWWNKVALILLCAFLILFILAISNAHKKLLFAALLSFLLLQVNLGFQRLSTLRQQKTIVFKLRRNYAIAHLTAQKAILYTDVDPQGKIFQYSIKPCLDQHQIKVIHIKFGTSELKKIKHL